MKPIKRNELGYTELGIQYTMDIIDKIYNDRDEVLALYLKKDLLVRFVRMVAQSGIDVGIAKLAQLIINNEDSN